MLKTVTLYLKTIKQGLKENPGRKSKKILPAFFMQTFQPEKRIINH